MMSLPILSAFRMADTRYHCHGRSSMSPSQTITNRLRGLLHRLKHTPSILREYNDIIRDQLAKGIVEPVVETDPTLNQVHYLLHHAVVRADKTTMKVRVVYDASAKSNGPSLNDCLHTGQSLIKDILVRFRLFKVALTADIERAFFDDLCGGKQPRCAPIPLG